MRTVDPGKGTVGGDGWGGNTDLSSYRKQLGKSLSAAHTWSEGDEAKLAGDKWWQEAVSCRMSGCWVCGCRECLIQVHGRKPRWGPFSRNVLSVLQQFSKIQFPGAWRCSFGEFTVTFSGLWSDVRTWVPQCFKVLYTKQLELQAGVSRAAEELPKEV